ncbi:hypothetical protein [Vibrio owensii]|uniref:hypothetical protein n=1 Tax=Vibrio owensii TaxID=696485 RepID=UPI0005864D96|nr:hypothetical protein [Vibrio owensii]
MRNIINTTLILICCTLHSVYAAQFEHTVISVETTIDTNQLIPPRLSVTGLNGGAINSGVLQGYALSGDINTVAPIYLEAWDTDNNQQIGAEWKLMSLQITTVDTSGSTTTFTESEFDVYFNDTLMKIGSSSSSIREKNVAISINNNRKQSLSPSSQLFAQLLVITEVTF